MKRLIPVLVVALAACGPREAPAPEPDTAADPSQLPPGTDVWLAELGGTGTDLTVGDPVNATRRAGYDNQPHFLPDGSGFWYTSIDEAGQADIWRYDLASGTASAVTATAPESEYSATPDEAGSGFSAIRVEADSTQRLWAFTRGGDATGALFEDIAPVGYHAWADESTVVMFVLGDPATLHVGDLEAGTSVVVARDIGRSIQRVPGSNAVTFVQRLEDGGTEIRRLSPSTGASEVLTMGIEGGDFHAWTPDGTLLQAHESRLFAQAPGGEWREITDLTPLGLRLSRLAVSPDGRWIALVGEALD